MSAVSVPVFRLLTIIISITKSFFFNTNSPSFFSALQKKRNFGFWFLIDSESRIRELLFMVRVLFFGWN
jgi:hypothetical protein